MSPPGRGSPPPGGDPPFQWCTKSVVQGRPYRHSRGTRRMVASRGTGGAPPGIFGLLLALFLIAALTLPGTAAPSSAGSGTLPLERPLSVGGPPPQSNLLWDSGNVTWSFSRAVPSILLSSDRNRSLDVGLALENILEVAPSPVVPGGPLGLVAFAVAEPPSLRTFNVTVERNGSGPAGVTIVMEANITVDRLFLRPGVPGLPLWSLPGGEIPPAALGSSAGTVTVTITFVLETQPFPSGGGARVSLNVTHWPWLAPTDQLALEWAYLLPANASSAGLCTALHGGGHATGGGSCGGLPSLAPDSPQWGNATSALALVQGSSTLSSLAWEPSANVTTSLGGVAGVSLASAFYSVSSAHTVRFLQVLPAGGEFRDVSEDPTISLLPPVVTAIVSYITGNLPVFAGAALVALGAWAGVLTVRRRREARALDRLVPLGGIAPGPGVGPSQHAYIRIPTS